MKKGTGCQKKILRLGIPTGKNLYNLLKLVATLLQVDRPFSQNLAFALSLLMIMVYFFWLREENDIDDAIRGLESQSLYERIEGLERADLLNYKRLAN